MSPPESIPAYRRAINIVYASSSIYGQFILGEELANGTAALQEYEELAGASPGCTSPSPDEEGLTITCHRGDRELVNVGGDRTVLVLQGGSVITVLWVEPASGMDPAVASEFVNPMLEVEIDGFGMSRDDAIAVARQFTLGNE